MMCHYRDYFAKVQLDRTRWIVSISFRFLRDVEGSYIVCLIHRVAQVLIFKELCFHEYGAQSSIVWIANYAIRKMMTRMLAVNFVIPRNVL